MEDEQNKQPIEAETEIEPASVLTEEEQKAQTTVYNGSRWHRLKNWYRSHKKLSIPLTILLLAVIIAAVPWSRYHAAALVLKRNFSMQVLDSATKTPVSGARVAIGSVSAETDNDGRATLHGVRVGSQKVKVSKKYYQDQNLSVLVPILSEKKHPGVSLQATGRQVKVSVKNLINKKPLENVEIKVAEISAKTDSAGNALLVLPAGVKEQPASLSLDGHNDAKVKVALSDREIKQNDFTLAPAGKIYFLSKLSGKIDVVKTNLDGTERKTVLAGTGKEEERGTVLLASRDWKYLGLLSRREGGSAKLYGITTNDDKLLSIDETDADIEPVGWYNHHFIYTVYKNGYNDWRPNAVSIKSYNAETGQLLTLVNSNATGTNNTNAKYEAVSDVLVMGDNVIYTRTWYKYPGYLQVSGKQNVIASIHPDGTGSRQIKSVDAGSSYISNVKLYSPARLYFGVYDDNSSDSDYYVVGKNGIASKTAKVAEEDLADEATTYLISPTGDNVFWAEERDGKNSLFIGDQDGNNAKQKATLSEYNPYGWFSDDYLLVSKNGSELYIIPESAIKTDSDAVKISDYHKPRQNFYGYGGGYGGI